MKKINNGIIIEATFIFETPEAYQLDCEGDVAWFAKSLVNYDSDKEELEAPKWLLKQKFPNEEF